MVTTETYIQNRYQLISILGQGGLGTVYYGWDIQLERTVAIKRLDRPSGFSDPTSEGYQEARTLAALQHPNIVTLYDFGMDEDGAYFIMEYLDGKTLSDYISERVLTPAEWHCLAQQCLEGLSAAHEAGIVHRDIKESNMMLLECRQYPFRVKLVDFGLAVIQDTPREQTTTLDGSIMGSIFSISPEQLSQHPVDCRTDLYSLSHVLYHCLAGETAYHGNTAAEMITEHLYGTPTGIQFYRSDLSDAVSDWLRWLMARNPDDRPATAQAALDALPAVDQMLVTETPIHTAQQAPAPSKFKLSDISPPEKESSIPWGWITGLIAVVGLMAGAYLYLKPTEVADPLVATAPAAVDDAPQSQPQAPPTRPQVNKPEETTRESRKILSVMDSETLSGMDGQEVTVEGVPIRVSENRKGNILYLNFTENYRESVSLVFFKDRFPGGLQTMDLEPLLNQKIRITGTLGKYRSDLQIIIRQMDQIQTL